MQDREYLNLYETNGGPFALIPKKKLALWGGVVEKRYACRYGIFANDYELACRSNFDVDFHEFGGQDAIFFDGTSHGILSLSDDNGLKFVCAHTMENNYVSHQQLLRSFSTIDWRSSSVVNLETGDDYVLFDSAICGRRIISGGIDFFESVDMTPVRSIFYFRDVKLALPEGNVIIGIACISTASALF